MSAVAPERSVRTGALSVAVVEESGAAEWDEWVRSHPNASVYHLWAWRRVFRDVFGHEVVYLAVRRGGRLTGLLPLVVFRTRLFGRFGVSLPFVNYGGVVADDAEGREALVTAAVDAARERSLAHLELRHTARLCPALVPKQHKVAMCLALAPAEGRQWDGFDRKVRNQVRKAEKSGLDVQIGGRELVPHFYPVFARNMRDLGTPVYTPRLFERVLELLPEQARVILVRKDEHVAAAGITIAWRGRVELPWASSRREFLPQCPNMLLYWTAIREAIRSGAASFDFGRSTPNEGTFHFKRQWGAEPHPLYWEYAMLNGQSLPDHSPGNPKLRLAISTWQRLPLGITNLVGPSIVRQIP